MIFIITCSFSIRYVFVEITNRLESEVIKDFSVFFKMMKKYNL